MGLATPATARRTSPISLPANRVNGIQRVSPAWRPRSRSYSHDKQEYRMGMRKDAHGKWNAVDGKVPQAMADAMRNMTRVNRDIVRRIKKEPTDDSEDVEMAETQPGIDTRDSTAGLQEIPVFLDVERGGDGAHVYVDGDGREMQTIIRSVEPKTDAKVERDVKFGVSINARHSSSATRDSLASIAEDDEDRMEVDVELPEEHQSQPQDEQPQPKRKRQRKWTSHEKYFVGALSDAGHKVEAIPNLLREKFQGTEEITMRSVTNLRTSLIRSPEHLKQVQLLGQELGLESGKWRRMQRELERQSILVEQENDRKPMIEDHRRQLDEGNKELALADPNHPAALRACHSKMHHTFRAQRADWRALTKQQYHRLLENGMRTNHAFLAHSVELNILVLQSKFCVDDDSIASGRRWYGFQPETQAKISQIAKRVWLRSWSNTYAFYLLFEYEILSSLLQERKGRPARDVLHEEVMELLDLGEDRQDVKSLLELREKGILSKVKSIEWPTDILYPDPGGLTEDDNLSKEDDNLIKDIDFGDFHIDLNPKFAEYERAASSETEGTAGHSGSPQEDLDAQWVLLEEQGKKKGLVASRHGDEIAPEPGTTVIFGNDRPLELGQLEMDANDANGDGTEWWKRLVQRRQKDEPLEADAAFGTVFQVANADWNEGWEELVVESDSFVDRLGPSIF